MSGVVKLRCKWCGEPLGADGFPCGTIGLKRGKQCLRNCAEGDTEQSSGGRKKTPERMEIEAMQVGESRRFPATKDNIIRSAQCYVAHRNDGTNLVVRKSDDGVTVHLVPDIMTMDVGDVVRYSDDLGLVTRLVYARNTAYAEGTGDRAYCFDFQDGFYNLRRVR